MKLDRRKVHGPTRAWSLHGDHLMSMPVRRYQDLIAWQLGDRFEREVHRLVLGSAEARSDERYKKQILEASTSVPVNICEGFLRFSRTDFARFLSYALGSLGEASRRLHTGIRRNYFSEAECELAFRLGRRCVGATIGLKRSQEEEEEE